MKYNEIRARWIGIAKFLVLFWLAVIIFAGLYFITKWNLFGLLMGITFIFAVAFTIGTLVYNTMETGKTVVSHKILKHKSIKKEKENICEICGKQTKTTWSPALRVCEECKKKM